MQTELVRFLVLMCMKVVKDKLELSKASKDKRRKIFKISKVVMMYKGREREGGEHGTGEQKKPLH